MEAQEYRRGRVVDIVPHRIAVGGRRQGPRLKQSKDLSGNRIEHPERQPRQCQVLASRPPRPPISIDAGRMCGSWRNSQCQAYRNSKPHPRAGANIGFQARKRLPKKRPHQLHSARLRAQNALLIYAPDKASEAGLVLGNSIRGSRFHWVLGLADARQAFNRRIGGGRCGPVGRSANRR